MIEKHGTGPNAFETTTNFWDCECPENHIHKASENREDSCKGCGQIEEDAPDSRVTEVAATGVTREAM